MKELIVSMCIWVFAIIGIIVMHRVQPENKTYKIWAILDAITISALMIYLAMK